MSDCVRICITVMQRSLVCSAVLGLNGVSRNSLAGGSSSNWSWFTSLTCSTRYWSCSSLDDSVQQRNHYWESFLLCSFWNCTRTYTAWNVCSRLLPWTRGVSLHNAPEHYLLDFQLSVVVVFWNEKPCSDGSSLTAHTIRLTFVKQTWDVLILFCLVLGS